MKRIIMLDPTLFQTLFENWLRSIHCEVRLCINGLGIVGGFDQVDRSNNCICHKNLCTRWRENDEKWYTCS